MEGVRMEERNSVKCPTCGIVQFEKPGRVNCVRCHSDLHMIQKAEEQPESDEQNSDAGNLYFKIISYLKRKRIAAKLSQREIAERYGCPRTFISKLEWNIQKPSLKTLEKLCAVYGTTMKDVLEAIMHKKSMPQEKLFIEEMTELVTKLTKDQRKVILMAMWKLRAKQNPFQEWMQDGMVCKEPAAGCEAFFHDGDFA
jgi:transcriptional regulator with XRE-family HTH domain